MHFERLVTNGRGHDDARAAVVDGAQRMQPGRGFGHQAKGIRGTGGVDEPEYTPGKLVGNHNPRKNLSYFNTSLFTQEPLGQVGSSQRRFFHGPGLDNTDLALLRNFHIHESQTAQFRAEAFNVFNHAQFNNPNGNWNNTSAFGLVTSANAPRILQLAVKYQF